MWNTAIGKRIFVGAERRLIMNAAWGLADSISTEATFNDNVQFGIVLFDRLTWQQQMLMLEKVLTPLLEPSIPAPQSTALFDATVAAIYAQLRTELIIELDMAELDKYDSFVGRNFDVRQEILDALFEPVNTDEPALANGRDHHGPGASRQKLKAKKSFGDSN